MSKLFTFTSFKRAAGQEGTYGEIWSSAVYQPKWFPQRPKATWMDIRPGYQGTWIRPREYVNLNAPLDGYFMALLDLYASRAADADEWLQSVGDNVAVCCWCPYDKAAQRQLKEFGTFVCHTAAVGRFLQELGYGVAYDLDREKMVMAYPRKETT